jgi:uracil-DNA glycosylase
MLTVPTMPQLADGWADQIGSEFEHPYFAALRSFVREERSAYEVYPPEADVFNALKLTSYRGTCVVLLGQDPYHDTGQAHGLSFSVRPGVRPPPSLANIFRELRSDVGCPVPNHGYLAHWAEQGVVMLNTVLTVRAHTANSHRGKGWERFTDAVIDAVNRRPDPAVFILWGAPAQKKLARIEVPRHGIVRSAHPSPLSANNGFFGSRPFSLANQLLSDRGASPIDWCIPNL